MYGFVLMSFIDPDVGKTLQSKNIKNKYDYMHCVFSTQK